MYIYTPTMEASALSMFVVWLQACLGVPRTVLGVLREREREKGDVLFKDAVNC